MTKLRGQSLAMSVLVEDVMTQLWGLPVGFCGRALNAACTVPSLNCYGFIACGKLDGGGWDSLDKLSLGL